MSIHLAAHDVTLEMPLDSQRASTAASGGLRAALSGAVRRYTTVLSRIEFSANEGDRIALVGLNGSGKSTLLRVLNGAFQPTRGVVRSSGRMQSLLNPGLGFSDYASVAENVILRGTGMGLRRAQLNAAMDDILDFSGLREKAMHRLHTLSAGQRMRLGFAISTAVQPDILLMDEWIATGDAVFVQRAQERMRDRFRDSRIVVLASHGADLQRQLCNKALVLDGGKMRYFGDVDEGFSVYRDIVATASDKLSAHGVNQVPLLFGDVSGFVERIRLLPRGIEVEGWAIGEKGREADAFQVDLDGRRYRLDAFERVGREDVLRAASRASGKYGFRFVLQDAEAADPLGITARLSVSVVNARGRVGIPLQSACGIIVEAA
ncbi:ABC transporter ATP-binding protein [Lysobacter enzymogenes]|uniref:ABC transporter ATP-binding protein n=1 Tax=Lysobacter enzymogenes TaxID=69 RepID=UPI001AF977B5|nr:ATP-binding cassette domain-containing protein [Lysobacter enzymogenes]QQQ02622.1 ABC transporter ATP-binding protein [Lysobacter enzymogenes]